MVEDNVLPLGPAGEDGFFGDEAVSGTVSSLVHQVHLALVQPALLKVVVWHAGVVLFPGMRGQGECGTWGDTRPPQACPRPSPHLQ